MVKIYLNNAPVISYLINTGWSSRRKRLNCLFFNLFSSYCCYHLPTTTNDHRSFYVTQAIIISSPMHTFMWKQTFWTKNLSFP